MKRSFILIVLAASSSAGVLLGSLVTADNTKYYNDFVRIFPPHAADIRTMVKIAPDRLHLAGRTCGSIYFWDRAGILIFTQNLLDTTRIKLDLSIGAEVMIDSPYFFIHNGSRGLLQRGDLSDWKIDTSFNDISGFTAIQPVSSNSAVIRTMNVSERKNFLIKTPSAQEYVLQKQIDGLLCTDGFLLYSKELNQLIYLYRYRNQFINLDMNMNVIRYGRTIDTTSVAKIAVAEVDGKITMAKPPLSVNNNVCVNGKYLFVQSNLLAKNESADRTKRQSAIDVYNIIEGSYMFSFHIENPGSVLQEFSVRNSVLVAVYKDGIVMYDLPQNYFP
jgi:hypothetical protein